MFDKSLYEMPMGLNPMLDSTTDQPLVIEIEDPEAVRIDGVEIRFDDDDAPTFDANLAEALEEGELGSISDELLDSYETDLQARSEWEDTY
ncbi:hypothetical protein RZS08_13315, partial [Arthrospira platensis SPKY1]|nr:hypothetical protein [Arthrospira platensis SPKY1]